MPTLILTSMFTLTQEDFLLLIFVLVSIVCVVAIAVLLKVWGITKKVDGILDDNRKNINELMETLPATISTVNESVSSIKKTVDSANNVIEVVEDNVVGTVTSITAKTENIVDVVKVVADVVRASVEYFREGK